MNQMSHRLSLLMFMPRITRMRQNVRAVVPVNGGMSVSVTISPSSMVVSEVI